MATITKFVTSPDAATKAFCAAIQKADKVWIATAWASDGTRVAKALREAYAKGCEIVLVVGVEHYFTDPAFLRRFRHVARIHAMGPGTFHPKVYAFRRGNKFEALVGSSNFTAGGFARNLEANLHLSGPTSDSAFHDFTSFVERLDAEGCQFSEADIDAYAKKHRAQRELVLNTAKPLIAEGLGSTAGFHVPWARFVARLRVQKKVSGHPLLPIKSGKVTMPGYVGVIEGIQAILAASPRLAEMPIDDRRRVAGVGGHSSGYFGSMVGAGYFKRYVNDSPERLDRALDHIPAKGQVTKGAFDAFYKALPKRGMGLAVASRLLAMKRPDLFLCVNSANRAGLSKAFALPQSSLKTFPGYWALLQQIWRCPWAQAPKPPRADERRIWKARVALIDACFYRG